MVYYNEIDPYAAQWLRNLIAAGHIAAGEVDERSICDVDPADLAGFTQCHFFAGIGVWSRALRLAGWPDDRPVWTGSCPCQPFSAAGKRGGFDDERHLWPEFFRLIRERRPPVVFGEQVASKDGLQWLDAVQVDLESASYASAAADLCAAGIGAPHIRQRLYWVADDNDQRQFLKTARLYGRRAGTGGTSPAQRGAKGAPGYDADGRGTDGRVDNNNNTGLEGQRLGHCAESGRIEAVRPVAEAGELGRMADAQHDDRRADEQRWGPQGRSADGWDLEGFGRASAASPTHGFWGAADWLLCRDGKWRPVEPGTFPLAHGVTARVGRLRAYGNAIVPQVAQAFIEAFMECRP